MGLQRHGGHDFDRPLFVVHLFHKATANTVGSLRHPVTGVGRLVAFLRTWQANPLVPMEIAPRKKPREHKAHGSPSDRKRLGLRWNTRWRSNRGGYGGITLSLCAPVTLLAFADKEL